MANNVNGVNDEVLEKQCLKRDFGNEYNNKMVEEELCVKRDGNIVVGIVFQGRLLCGREGV